ncbi:MAG: N-acetylmuramoyl-L-alanine amidase [Candidatus Roizmanbacteria bacterium]|nr:MAG: N-acetylmuramoyl-L-alanine amidase [Candidatus Roizmanbacteria bacterium]
MENSSSTLSSTDKGEVRRVLSIAERLKNNPPKTKGENHFSGRFRPIYSAKEEKERNAVVDQPNKRLLLKAIGAGAILAVSGGLALKALGSDNTPSVRAEPNPSAIPSPAAETTAIAATEKPETTPEPPKERGGILTPEELVDYSQVIEFVGKLRNSHDSVLSESLFTKELAGFSTEKRQEVLKAIAKAHAQALVEYYGDNEAIIGLDPGHGSSDVGSSGTTPEGKTIAEKELTWEVSQMLAEELKTLSHNRYFIVILRPHDPQDRDLDGDGTIAPVERIQKRKALLMKMEQKLRDKPEDIGKNILYLSMHFNGSSDPNQGGAEMYWPNSFAVKDDNHRQASEALAKSIQDKTVTAIRKTGYNTFDRKAKEDPDKNMPTGNISQVGPYLVLGSPRLDNLLQKA